jgi:arylsulfatase A-like enzyme
VSDKPAPFNTTASLTAAQIAQVSRDRLQIGRSLLGVNDGITTMLSALDDTGRLADTAIFFTSDNGYMLGEHRLFKKGEPFEEPSHVPLLVRWPGAAGRRETGVASSIDIAATVCTLAGAVPPSADGVDLSRLLDSRTAVRDAAYIEAPGNQWDGLRTGTFKYVERRTGARELYDLAADPSELVNRAGSPAYAGTRSALATRLGTLRR